MRKNRVRVHEERSDEQEMFQRQTNRSGVRAPNVTSKIQGVCRGGQGDVPHLHTGKAGPSSFRRARPHQRYSGWKVTALDRAW